MARFSIKAILAALTALLLMGSASAHMIMNTPAGFPGIIDQVNPLNPPQFQFPCQAGPNGNYNYTTATTATAGSSIFVNFTGSAVHGGGICQYSVATYPPPADPKEWKVIYTIIGCPASAPLNLASIGEDAEGRADGPHCADTGTDYLNCVKSYDIPIPNLKNGEYIFSWTWLNRLGNREIYQSCAPISVGGGNQSLDISDLPSIFFANYYPSIPNCSTAEGVLLLPEENYNISLTEWSDYLPDAPQASAIGNCSSYYGMPTAISGPASYISLSKVAATGSLSAMTSSWVSTGTVSAGSSSTPALSAASSAATSSSTSSISYQSTSTTTVKSTVYASMAASKTSSGSASSSTSSQASTGSSPANNSSSFGFIGAPGTMNSSGGTVVFAECTIPCNGQPDGTVLCVGSTQFGICNFGCAVPMDLAAGTTCSNGTITKRSLSKSFDA